MSTTGLTYGWYLEGGRFGGTGSELQPLIERALVSTPSEKVKDIRVGEMRKAEVSDYIDIDHILEYLKNGAVLTPGFLVDMVGTQYHDVVDDGSAYLISGSSAWRYQSPLDTDKDYAEWVAKWAAENIALDPEMVCEGEPIKTITIQVPVTFLVPTISQVRKWLMSQGWEVSPLIPPFEKWVKGVYWTQVPNDESLTDWCDVIQRWISQFALNSKYVGMPMTEEFICRSILKEAP